MYAFRKPFAAATFAGQAPVLGHLDYKTALLIAQVLGYALSKLIGIRIIAEFGRDGRAQAILGLMTASWLALVLFAVLPAPWNGICLFLNGLPLGMIWGLVFSYAEGRRTSEILGAVLCASFIVSSGMVKSLGMVMMDMGVSEWWMPAMAGALFFPLLGLSLWVLEGLPPPDPQDEAERVPRMPMRRADRMRFLHRHGLSILLLVAGYVLLTAVRDFRDSFAAELWQAMGYGDVASVFSQSEIPVALIALAGLGALMLVRDNMRALMVMHGVIIVGAAVLGFSTLAFRLHMIAPIPYMILTGAGLYIAYTPFSAMLFDRMIAAIGGSGNAGFLIYLADSAGYTGSVGLLLFHSFAASGTDWLGFYCRCAYGAAVAVAGLTFGSVLCFARALNAPHAREGLRSGPRQGSEQRAAHR